ncbi:MAG: CP12 domain-containing protein [Prochlorococcaceae cyanobacterium]
MSTDNAESITSKLASYRASLDVARAKGEQALARKLEQQIEQLVDFQARHPEISEAPSAFEVFCDLNPSDINCRVYDD